MALPAGTKRHTGGEADFGFEEEAFAEVEGVREAFDFREQIKGAFRFGNSDAGHGAVPG